MRGQAGGKAGLSNQARASKGEAGRALGTACHTVKLRAVPQPEIVSWDEF